MTVTGRIIRISVDDKVTEINDVDFSWPGLNKATLGADTLIEMVRPKGFLPHNNKLDDDFLVLIVDEDGLNKDLQVNRYASFLYGTQFHGQPIVGEAFVMVEGFAVGEDGYPDRDFKGLPDEVTVATIDDLIKSAMRAGSPRELEGR